MKTINTFIIVSFLLYGCSDNENDTYKTNEKENIQNDEFNAKLTSTKNKIDIKTNIVKKTDYLVNKIIKEVDDFGAAIGTQYARFSYNTNRVLTYEHTNFLMQLPAIEFTDFFRDFDKACCIRGITSNEYALLDIMLRDRMEKIREDEEWFYLMDAINCFYNIRNATKYSSVKDIAFVSDYIDAAYNHFKKGKSSYPMKVSISKSLNLYMNDNYLNKYEDMMIEKYIHYSQVDEIDTEFRVVILRFAAETEYRRWPKKAIERMESIKKIIETENLNKKGLSYEYFDIKYQAMRKNLKGEEYIKYINDEFDKRNLHERFFNNK